MVDNIVFVREVLAHHHEESILEIWEYSFLSVLCVLSCIRGIGRLVLGTGRFPDVFISYQLKILMIFIGSIGFFEYLSRFEVWRMEP